MVSTEKITDGVQDTLFIPLLMRYRDLREKHPILGDTAAGEIYERIDYDWSRYDRKGTTMSYIGCLVRARYIDGEVERLARDLDRAPVIVNAGCGLDTRHHRLVGRVPEGSVRVDLDFPEVMVVREQVVPPLPDGRGHVQALSGSILDEEMLSRLRALAPEDDTPFIIALEGVLMYFTEDQVRELLALLRKVLGREVYIVPDVSHPMMVGHGKYHDELKRSKADFMSGFSSCSALASLLEGAEPLGEMPIMDLMRPYTFIARLASLFPPMRRNVLVCTLRLH